MGIGLGLAIALYFMSIVANLTGSAEFLNCITPFGYCDGSTIMNKGVLDTGRMLIGLAFTVAGVALAYWKYTKKDIR